MKNTVVILICIAIFVGCLLSAGALSVPINQDRRDSNLMMSDDLSSQREDTQVLQAATGIFRGVALNYMWQRAEGLKEEGKYHEAVQLGEYITRLQPKFSQVWEFVSWNQAYNISVGTHTPEERWFWVKSGVDLLQNQKGGIDSNPNAMRLYWQLGYIYLHKIGFFQDTYNWYYKQQIASKWHNILGETPGAYEEFDAWLMPIVEAPDTVEGLSEDARKLAQWVQGEGIELDDKMLYQFTARVGGEVEDENSNAVEDMLQDNDDGEYDDTVFGATLKSFPDWASEDAKNELLAFVRRRIIRGPELNMEPDRMLADTRAIGPLDWRHPLTHSIYWARRGLERAETDDRDEEGIANVRRMVIGGLEAQAMQGKVVYDPVTGNVNYLPAFRFWSKLFEYYQNTRANFNEEDRAQFDKMFGPGFRSRMDGAIAQAELMGDHEGAVELYNTMAELYKDESFGSRYQIDFNAFLEQQYADTMDNPDTIRATLMQLLSFAYIAAWVNNDDETAEEVIAKVANLHAQWRERNADPGNPQYHEVAPLGQLHMNAIGAFLTGYSYEANGAGNTVNVDVPTQIEVWASLEDSLKEMIFPLFGDEIYDHAYNNGYNPFTSFPPPQRFVFEGRPLTPEEARNLIDGKLDIEAVRSRPVQK